MGSKKTEQLGLIETMDQIIAQLENRLRGLKESMDKEVDRKGLSPTEGSADAGRLQKEIAAIESRLSYIRAEKKEAQKLLNAAEKTEERERIENIFKCAVYVGVVKENLRAEAERGKRMRGQEAELWQNIGRSADELFEKKTFRYVKRSDVEKIMKNPEFRMMAEQDETKLERECAELKDEYEHNMERTLSIAGEAVGDSFEENEEKFRQFLSNYNGFEKVYELMSDIRDDIFLSNGQESAQDEADKKEFAEIMKAVKELAMETGQLQKEFITGVSDFRQGNGYTRELIQKEAELCDRVETFSRTLISRFLELDRKKEELKRSYKEEGKDPTLADKLYDTNKTGEKITLVLKMATPIKQQLERDTVLQKMEMWEVYKQLQKGRRPDTRMKKKNTGMQEKAWLKLKRMKKLAMQKGGIYVEVADWAAEAAQQLMERANGKEPLSKRDEAFLREKMAAVVVNQIFLGEMKQYDNGAGEGYYVRTLRKNQHKEVFLKLAKDLSETKEFQKVFSAYMKGGEGREKCMSFLAQDMEKEWTKKVKNRIPSQVEPGIRK